MNLSFGLWGWRVRCLALSLVLLLLSGCAYYRTASGAAVEPLGSFRLEFGRPYGPATNTPAVVGATAGVVLPR